MNLFDVIAVLLTLAAVFGYLNHRFLRLEPSVGLLMISLASSLGIMLLHWIFPGLAIVHQLTMAMDGKVDIVNREIGAEFTVKFSRVPEDGS